MKVYQIFDRVSNCFNTMKNGKPMKNEQYKSNEELKQWRMNNIKAMNSKISSLHNTSWLQKNSSKIP